MATGGALTSVPDHAIRSRRSTSMPSPSWWMSGIPATGPSGVSRASVGTSNGARNAAPELQRGHSDRADGSRTEPAFATLVTDVRRHADHPRQGDCRVIMERRVASGDDPLAHNGCCAVKHRLPVRGQREDDIPLFDTT